MQMLPASASLTKLDQKQDRCYPRYRRSQCLPPWLQIRRMDSKRACFRAIFNRKYVPLKLDVRVQLFGRTHRFGMLGTTATGYRIVSIAPDA